MPAADTSDISCRNLASHVLGRAARAVGDDCERLYGYRPWLLETFVDETEHTGASVRAANWVRVGETRGRGRQDRTHAARETCKAVYMYALEPAWRDTLQAPAPRVAPLAVGDGLDAESWAGREFGGARLGDARLSARLVLSAHQMAESPMRAITGAATGGRALVKGHYRLIDQPAESAVTVENILAPHRERTLRRMRTHDTVLCLQDGTRLSFTGRSQTEGLGVIGSNQTGAVARGLDLHTTLAVNPDGVALGVLRAAFDAPAPPNPEEKGQPKPREARKSFRWVEGLRDCAAAAERLGETRVVCTMDREADFLDLFIERRAHAPRVDLLVRAKVDRVLGREKTADGQTVSRRLFEEVRNAPARGAALVEVRRLSARVKASKQPRKDGRAARVAEVTLRYRQVSLPCPGAEPVELFVVHAREEQPPPAVKPLEWFVLTTLPVTSADDATRILGWYALRWRIEEYFPGHQVRLQGRGVAAPHGGAARAGHCHQDGRGVADPVDGPARARDARLAGGPAVFRRRVARAGHLRPLPQSAGTHAPRGRRRSGGPPRRVAGAQARPARRAAPVVWLRQARRHELRLRAAGRVRMSSHALRVQPERSGARAGLAS